MRPDRLWIRVWLLSVVPVEKMSRLFLNGPNKARLSVVLGFLNRIPGDSFRMHGLAGHMGGVSVAIHLAVTRQPGANHPNSSGDQNSQQGTEQSAR
jgi:hypothetical protein